MGKTFRDTCGRVWTVAINIATVKRIRDVKGINLVQANLSGVLEQLADPVTLCDLIYLAVKPEADRLNVSDEDFGRAMAGECIEQASMAFLDALADFIPDPRSQAQMRRVLQTMAKAITAVRDQASQKIDQEMEEIERALEDLNRSTTGGPKSGDSPALSESIPAV